MHVATLGRFVPITILVASVAVSLFVSTGTPPEAGELAGFRAVERCASVVRSVAERGPAGLGSARARLTYDGFQGQGTGAALLGAWSSLSIGRVGLVDLPTSARLPWLVLAALTPPLLYCWLRPLRGLTVAALAALGLLLLPRWLHASVMAGGAASVAGCWWLVLLAYARSLAPRDARHRRRSGSRALCWALAAALALGFGAAWSLSSLWVVPIVALHFCVTRWHELGRLGARGRLPIPVFLLVAVVVSPLVTLLLNPALWGASAAALARWLLAPLSAAGASAATDTKLPPTLLLICVVMGLLVIIHRGLARRFAAGRLRPQRDAHAVDALLLIGLGFTLLGPLRDPGPLSLPFAAAAAGIGLGWALGAVRAWWNARRSAAGAGA